MVKELKFEVGDSVMAEGRSFQSANGTLYAGKVDKVIATIKKTAPKAAHPYALEGVNGWFNENSLKKYAKPEVEVGDKVRLIRLKTYRGFDVRLPQSTVYILEEIDQDKALIRNGKTITFQVNVFDLQKA